MKKEQTKVEEDIEWVVDDTPDHVYLSVMCEAYLTADSINPMTGREEERKKRIMKKSLMVIDKIVSDMHKEFIDGED